MLTGLIFVGYNAEKERNDADMEELKVGLRGQVTSLVEMQDTAQEVGFGSLKVFATPCMVAMMEGAAYEALEGLLPEGQTSVGTRLEIRHTSATPVGLEVRAEAELTAVEGKKLTFQVRAYDEKGEIGSGTHERVLVSEQRFLDKTYEKL